MRKLKTIFLLLGLVCFPYFDVLNASSVIVYTLGIPTIANDELADFWLTGPRGSSKGVITELGIGDVNGIAEAGTLPGENAHVYVMPRRLSKNGVMLCVTQIQASTDHGDKWPNRAEKTAGFTLYETDNKTCKWFCVDGYYGDGCSKTYTDAPPVCDMTDYSKDWYGELKVRSTGGKSGMATGFVYKYLKDSYAEVKDGKNDKLGRMTGWMVPFVLVSTPDEPHGVQIENWSLLEMAAFQGSNRYDRVSGYQNRNNVLSLLTFYPEVKAAFGEIKYGGRKLCASGYKLDANKKCVEIPNSICEKERNLSNLCTGFPRESYKGSAVMELYEYNGCYKYKCLGDNVGFRSINDKTCITCPPRSGVLTSGVCSTPCNEIQHFDREKQECVTNTAYTHAELKYGKGNMVSRGFEHDCWPLLNEDEYTNCVVNGGR